MALRQATLRAARMLSPDVRELTLDPGPGFTFVPGQWVSLRLPQDGAAEPLARSYSIASWPREDRCIDLAVTRVSDGPGSGYLHALEPGAALPMTEAQGFFTMPAAARPRLLVATGTGVAPLRAMLHAALERGDAGPFVLLFGVRTEADVLYADEFAQAARAHERFRFVPTLSRPGPGWAGRTGYVQTHLPALVGELGGDCEAYVCGLSAMITDVRRVLKEGLGFTRHRIHTERYD